MPTYTFCYAKGEVMSFRLIEFKGDVSTYRLGCQGGQAHLPEVLAHIRSGNDRNSPDEGFDNWRILG